MRIKLEQLPSQLQKQTAQLYVLFGNEPLLILEATDLIRDHARQHGYTERALFSVDQHFDWSDLFNASNNLSLFIYSRQGDKRKRVGGECIAIGFDGFAAFLAGLAGWDTDIHDSAIAKQG